MVNYRFISISKTTCKISIPKPKGGYFYKSIGLIKQGKESGIQEAIKQRNAKGNELWGKYWKELLNNEKFLLELPRNLEPVLTLKKKDCYEYRANWIEYLPNGKKQKKSVRYSCCKWGKLTAYILAKKKLLSVYEPKKDLLKLMDRWTKVDLL